VPWMRPPEDPEWASSANRAARKMLQPTGAYPLAGEGSRGREQDPRVPARRMAASGKFGCARIKRARPDGRARLMRDPSQGAGWRSVIDPKPLTSRFQWLPIVKAENAEALGGVYV